jgi:hypothetical protein
MLVAHCFSSGGSPSLINLLFIEIGIEEHLFHNYLGSRSCELCKAFPAVGAGGMRSSVICSLLLQDMKNGYPIMC